MTKAQLMEVSVLVAGSAPKRVDCGGHSVTTAELGSTLSVAATACPNLARGGACCVCECVPSTACVRVCVELHTWTALRMWRWWWRH